MFGLTKAQLLVLGRGAILAIIGALMTVIFSIADGWVANPETFPKVDFPSLWTAVKGAILVGVSYILNKIRTGIEAPAQKTIAAVKQDKTAS